MKAYSKITRFGESCVTDEPGIVVHEIEDNLADPADDFAITVVWMTPEAYENLPEFQGW